MLLVFACALLSTPYLSILWYIDVFVLYDTINSSFLLLKGAGVMKKQREKKTKFVPKEVRPIRAFLYRVEYAPNPEVVVIHTKKRLPAIGALESGVCNLRELRCEPRGTREKRHSLYRALLGVRGLKDASPDDYELQIEKARLFTWKRVLPGVLKALQAHLAAGRPMKALGKPLHSTSVGPVEFNGLLEEE